MGGHTLQYYGNVELAQKQANRATNKALLDFLDSHTYGHMTYDRDDNANQGEKNNPNRYVFYI